MTNAYSRSSQAIVYDLLIQNDSAITVEDDFFKENDALEYTKSSLQKILTILRNSDTSDIHKEWQSIPKTFNLSKIDIDSIDLGVAEFIEDNVLTNQEIKDLALNLHILSSTVSVSNNTHIDKVINQIYSAVLAKKVLNSNLYQSLLDKIEVFQESYKTTFSEKIFRYLIGINAGFGAGNVVYAIATSFLLILPVMAVSGSMFFLLGAVITLYFVSSYDDVDKNFVIQLNNYEKSIRQLAAIDGKKTYKCNILLNNLQQLAQKASSIEKLSVVDKANFMNLMQSQSDSLTAFEKYTNNRVNSYPSRVSTIDEVNHVQEGNHDSIYTRVFHSKIWGPVLNFFGASGTIFGVTKTILALVGVTALLGSPIALIGMVAGAAIFISAAFAIKHFLINKKSEKRKRD